MMQYINSRPQDIKVSLNFDSLFCQQYCICFHQFGAFPLPDCMRLRSFLSRAASSCGDNTAHSQQAIEHVAYMIPSAYPKYLQSISMSSKINFRIHIIYKQFFMEANLCIKIELIYLENNMTVRYPL